VHAKGAPFVEKASDMVSLFIFYFLIQNQNHKFLDRSLLVHATPTPFAEKVSNMVSFVYSTFEDHSLGFEMSTFFVTVALMSIEIIVCFAYTIATSCINNSNHNDRKFHNPYSSIVNNSNDLGGYRWPPTYFH
jgi:hypothetical protein